MRVRAMEGTCLAALVRMAGPILQAAKRQCPGIGPGRPPEYQDWQIGVLVIVAVLARRKSKSGQFRFLYEHRLHLMRLLKMRRFPARSTYFDRYRKIWPVLEAAIRVQGLKAIREGIADPTTVAADKSLIWAKGPQWHHGDRRRGVIPKGLTGVDRDSTWSFSEYHGWVQGYSYEAVVTSGKKGVVLPILASADTANVSEHVSFGPKIAHLPTQTRYVLVDRGYDNASHDEAIEGDRHGRRTSRRFICGENRRAGRSGKSVSSPRQRRRHRRIAFSRSPAGRRLSARRSQTIEPFNEWFKSLFELSDRVWHRGLANNRTQLLAAICGYQLLVRYNHRRRRPNGQVKWILDIL